MVVTGEFRGRHARVQHEEGPHPQVRPHYTLVFVRYHSKNATRYR